MADTAIIAPLLPVALYFAAAMEASGRAGPEIFLSALGWVSLASLVYHVIPTAVWGQTPGKWMVGIRVLGPNGQPPGWVRSTIRGLVGALADLLFNTVGIGIIDPLWLLWDSRRQTLHDKAAGTVVVTARPCRAWRALVIIVVVSLGVQAGLIFGVVRSFIITAYYVPSASMHPTLMKRDRLIVNRLAYDCGTLRRGDLIVFLAPRNALYANPVENPDLNARKDFIKRLIGLPGDTVQVKDGRLWLKKAGEPALHTVEEPYLQGLLMDGDWGPVTVPPGQVVVLGDNRNNSNDSRRWKDPAATDERGRVQERPNPFLPIANIRGRAFFRYWPPWRWGELPRGEL